MTNQKHNLIKGMHNNAGLFQPKFGSNMDKPKCWIKNVV